MTTLFSRLIYRVKDQKWIPNHGQNADIGFVCNVSGEWKFFEELRQAFDPFNDRCSSRTIAFEDRKKSR
jgi:hypothetical protein